MTRKRQDRLQGIPNTVRVPCDRKEEEVQEKPTTVYLSAPSVIGNGLGWSITTLIAQALFSDSLDWLLILSPFIVAIGLFVMSKKKEIEDE